MFGDRIVFTSEAARGTPRYRFTYTRVSADALRIKFEIAPPGKDFATYIEAGATKAQKPQDFWRQEAGGRAAAGNRGRTGAGLRVRVGLMALRPQRLAPRLRSGLP